MLFTFPSQYWFAIGLPGVFSLAGWAPLFLAGFLVSCDTQDEDRKFSASPTGLSPPAARHSMRFCSRFSPLCLSYYPDGAVTPSVWALPRSLAATYGIDVSFSSSAYLDVSVQRVPSVYLWIQYTVTEVYSAGFPHSDICGSSDICSLPQLFAAYHVFLRLSVPRHPPCALSNLTLQHT